MDALTQLVMLCVCGAALGEPLGAALRRHSRYGVYAGEFARYYEPHVYAAIPLHAPVPVLRVLSPAPLDTRRAPSVQHPVYARPPYADVEYASSAHTDYDVEPYEPQYASRYQSPQLYAAASNAPEEPTILYARPNAHGGYTYHNAPRKPPRRAPPAPAHAPAPDAPYILRVHKYKLIKDR